MFMIMEVNGQFSSFEAKAQADQEKNPRVQEWEKVSCWKISAIAAPGRSQGEKWMAGWIKYLHWKK